jgi:hypothetical protein
MIVRPSEFVGDRWDQIPPTPEWKHVTRTIPENERSDACKTVVQALETEMSCHSVTCTPARDMADEWLLRCPPHVPELETQVEGMKADFARRMAEPPTECAQRAALILRDGCGTNEQCLGTVQRWMTRCRTTDSTPLVLAKLEAAVVREVPGGAAELDTRSCDELKTEFDKAAKCVHKFRCDEAIGRAEAYVERCLPDRKPPPTAVALTWLTAIAGAQKTIAPTPLSESRIPAGSHPLAFADGRGTALRVCEERVDDLAEYLEARDACVNGVIRLARIFDADGGPKLTMGVLAFPDDATFRERYPTLLLASELEERDARALVTFEPRLDEVAKMSNEGRKAEAWKALADLLSDHASSLSRSSAASAKASPAHPLWGALAKRDGDLAPLFEELGRAKAQKATRGQVGRDELVGFARRALERPLADVRWDGVIEAGAPSPGANMDWTRLPKSHARYLEAVADVKRHLGEGAARPEEQKQAIARARARAEACGAAEATRKKTEDALIACGFGLAACDAAKIQALSSQNDEARRDLDEASRELYLLVTGPANAARKDVVAAAEASGCPRIP